MAIDLGELLEGYDIEQLAGLLGGLLNDENKARLNEWLRAELDALIDKATGRREDLIIQLYAKIEDLEEENAYLKAQINNSADDDEQLPQEPPEPNPDPPTPGDGDDSGEPPSYAAGRVVIPKEFLQHGAFTELRFEKCSTANGLLKHAGGRVYTLPGPEHEVWRWTDEQGRQPPRCIGTRAKFADGTMYDGFVYDYRSSYSMPIASSGRAFWVKMR